MYWRTSRASYEAGKGKGNRTALRALVDAGQVPGLIGTRDGTPVGWVAVGPRESFPRLRGIRGVPSMFAAAGFTVDRPLGTSRLLVRRALARAQPVSR
jgi:hypothetical protein